MKYPTATYRSHKSLPTHSSLSPILASILAVEPDRFASLCCHAIEVQAFWIELLERNIQVVKQVRDSEEAKDV
jgi:hypothetical protein